jgi:hypothetical protein
MSSHTSKKSLTRIARVSLLGLISTNLALPKMIRTPETAKGDETNTKVAEE